MLELICERAQIEDGLEPIIHQPAKVLPYHFGRRACPGIVLANLELFYITVNMLK